MFAWACLPPGFAWLGHDWPGQKLNFTEQTLVSREWELLGGEGLGPAASSQRVCWRRTGTAAKKAAGQGTLGGKYPNASSTEETNKQTNKQTYLLAHDSNQQVFCLTLRLWLSNKANEIHQLSVLCSSYFPVSIHISTNKGKQGNIAMEWVTTEFCSQSVISPPLK